MNKKEKGLWSDSPNPIPLSALDFMDIHEDTLSAQRRITGG